MNPLAQTRLVGRLFWTFVLGWVVLLLIGLAWRLPYVERGYAGVTLPLYGGAMLLALALASLRSGSVWRGSHPPLERATARPVYWGVVTLLFTGAAVLLSLGTYHFLHRP
jgi:hypothetical protein